MLLILFNQDAGEPPPPVDLPCEDLGVLDLSALRNTYVYVQRMQSYQTQLSPLVYKILNRTVGANNG